MLYDDSAVKYATYNVGLELFSASEFQSSTVLESYHGTLV